MHILIVDDEKDIRETLRDLFEDEGYTVSLAEDGAEALAHLPGLASDTIVILDLVLPVMTGNQVYDAMQRDVRMSKMPVVITTSDPARAPEGVLVMRKPLHLQRLLDAVERLAGGTKTPSQTPA